MAQYDMLEEYVSSTKKTYENLVQMQNLVVKQFRNKYLFPKIETISRAFISDVLKFNQNPFNCVGNDWLQIYHPERPFIHLEWLLENQDQPGFTCEPNCIIPLRFHIERLKEDQRTMLLSYIAKYITYQHNESLRKVETSWWWNNTDTNSTLDIEISETYKPWKSLLRVEALQETTAKYIEQWLPELLQTPPVQLLLKLLTDETFWKRSEIRQIVS